MQGCYKLFFRGLEGFYCRCRTTCLILHGRSVVLELARLALYCLSQVGENFQSNFNVPSSSVDLTTLSPNVSTSSPMMFESSSMVSNGLPLFDSFEGFPFIFPKWWFQFVALDGLFALVEMTSYVCLAKKSIALFNAGCDLSPTSFVRKLWISRCNIIRPCQRGGATEAFQLRITHPLPFGQ
jgi:hypothetical protein